MTDIPSWANELALKVCKDHRRWPPSIKWKQTNSFYSTGVTYTYGRGAYDILIRAGLDKADVKLVLLHELAHYILCKTKKGRREHHSIRFWRLAFKLYDKYGIDVEVANRRERHYMVKAQWAYAEHLARTSSN